MLRAWERAVQVEASGKVRGLFPNLEDADETSTEDEEAGAAGIPFTHTEAEDEWEGLIDWEEADWGSRGWFNPGVN